MVYVGKYGEDDRSLPFEKPDEITKCAKQVVLCMVILGKYCNVNHSTIHHGQPIGIDR